MSKANLWFVPGEGIAREVITADIQRYLGPDALVKPGTGSTGEYEGRPGYWITAYRTLTSAMIQDLKLDSSRWHEEQQGRLQSGRGVAQYQDSRTHAARQHWGPSTPYVPAERDPPPPPPANPRTTAGYPPSSNHQPGSADTAYTSAPNPAYSQPYSAAPATAYATPRTAPDPYAAPRESPGYAQNAYNYQQQAPTEPYRTTGTTAYSQPSNVAQPGYYYASDGRQYPRRGTGQ